MRISKVKENILAILKNTKSPISAELLVEKIGVNKTSVYRQLNSLVGEGVVCECIIDATSKRYELSELGHHHHLVCIKCKNIQDVVIDKHLIKQEEELEKNTGYKIINHHLEFFGICTKCQ